MSDQSDLLRSSNIAEETASLNVTGLLPSQVIGEMIRNHEILSVEIIDKQQLQPASLDLRLDGIAYRVRSSFLPGRDKTVRESLRDVTMGEVDLRGGAILEKGCVYIVPLKESVALPSRIAAVANPKSSIGRLDIFTRLITNEATEFDRVQSGYSGPLYAEISPRAFTVIVREGSSLNQIRFRRGNPNNSDASLRRLHQQWRLVDRPDADVNIENGIALSVDLRSFSGGGVVGYKARKHTDLIDIDLIDYYPPGRYWEPIYSEGGKLILNPGDFHILMSKELVTVPPDHAAEMIPYDPLVGEFRVHYAGFFDPGFGYRKGGVNGTRAVLEVRSHEVPFIIEDGQVIGRLSYERLTDIPKRLYGGDIGSSYQEQGLKLSKHFARSEA
jgi:dCTP deaminase